MTNDFLDHGLPLISVNDPVVVERVRRPSRPARPDRLSGLVAMAIVGAIFAMGALFGWALASVSTPRPAPAVVAAGTGDRAQGRPGASRSGMAVKVPGAEATRAEPAPAGRVGAPSPAAVVSPRPPDELEGGLLALASRSGLIAYADRSMGDSYLAIPIGPGHHVRVCGPGGCWDTVSTDAGPNHERLVAGRIADVALIHWLDICGVPKEFGLCEGTWTVVPTATPPATDR